MVILITGASHTGKTVLAQRLLEKYKFPYLSIDHLKMGLIRSKYTNLTPYSDDREMTAYLWPIVREMIKTVIENKQNLIVEGCYIPADWHSDFTDEYMEHIKCFCLVMSEDYIRSHFDDIRKHACAAEARLDDSALNPDTMICDNLHYLALKDRYQAEYILIDKDYSFDITI